MRKITAITITLALFVSGAAYALTADEIVRKASAASYYQGKDGRADVNMVITDSLGRTRERYMTILRYDHEDNGPQRFYVYFHRPSDVEGMSYLVWKKPGEDDDRWLYLPALDLVRRVAASDKRSSFVGSHFAYEEISGRGPEEDTHELEGEEDGKYKIRSTPREPGEVEFSYFVTWVNKDNFVPVRAELYDKRGKLYKTIEALEIKDIEGYPTVVKMKASDLNTGGNTVSEFSDIDYDIGLEEDIFTERYLRRPPRRYIR
ncbi:MAG: outer membrane lipoprotein-sorting protein [Candidatus Omnitrophica bacterium]|nr:outer membrane lipoprotein-sorting protein [Candidatus Omnitrophota bacterium]